MAKSHITPLIPRAVPKGLLSMDEAAAYLMIQKGTLYNWVAMRRIAYVKIGVRNCFRQADLDAFIDAHRFAALAK